MKKLGCLFLIPVVGMGLLFLGIMMTVTSENDSSVNEDMRNEEFTYDGDYRFNGVSPEIERYRPFFEKYAKENGIEDHTEILMAMTMQESGGRLADVMQSSESLGLPVNTITDPEESIQQGVYYFSTVLESAGGDTELALQSYNMGHGFIDYAKEHNNGEYSQPLAQQFSNHMKQRLGWNVYGDPNYIDNVFRYLDTNEPDYAGGENSDWVLPLKEIRITSEFGPRTHPITGEVNSFHGGLDFGCTPSDDILSVKDGKVIEAIHSNIGYGNYVTVKHGGNEFSRYAHLTSIGVRNGQSVNQGDSVGKCGTTGSSTGNHLHLEHMTELGQPHNAKKDPKETLGL
ncbi:lysozyme family protein [Alkalicoccobacillus gibsonii]|uniref:lysozyme family protein n=1 Tax=Alkalicoccobacillus gibsonii TaxID=79881 RepID=UPI003F7BE7AF